MITDRMESAQLNRTANVTDQYGTRTGTPVNVATINVSISILTNEVRYDLPQYKDVDYIGLTTHQDVKEGDQLITANRSYRVEKVGDKRTRYVTLFLKSL